jgi:hypothetical protein
MDVPIVLITMDLDRFTFDGYAHVLLPYFPFPETLQPINVYLSKKIEKRQKATKNDSYFLLL